MALIVEQSPVTDVIPVLDLSPLNETAPDPAAVAALASDLRRALTEMGFFFIVNHGVPWEMVDGIFDSARNLHALPQPAKDSIPMGKLVGGYLGMGGGTSYASDIAGPVRKPNQNEAFFCHRHGYHESNQFPPIEGFAARVEAYIDQVINLGGRLLGVLAQSLDLPHGLVRAGFRLTERDAAHVALPTDGLLGQRVGPRPPHRQLGVHVPARERRAGAGDPTRRP